MTPRSLILIVLLSQGFVAPAWASPSTLPELYRQEIGTVQLNEPQMKPVTPPMPLRGQLLYENHCMSCHESVVHIRSTKHTRSLQELHRRVLDWAEYQKLCWGREEVDDVVKYLNAQYYKFGTR